MSGVRRPGVLATVLLALAVGCTGDLPANDVTCTDTGTLTLIAQAVPEAGEIPCFDRIPFAYRTTTLDVEAGWAEIGLSHEVVGADAAVLTIAPRCEVDGEVVATPPAGSRDERLDRGEAGGPVGTWVEGLDGACMVVTLAMDHPDGDRALTDLDGSWRVMPRDRLAATLREQTDGRLLLQQHAED